MDTGLKQQDQSAIAAASEKTQAAGRLLCLRSVRDLPGVAGRRAALLGRLGIETWFDLLCHFPRAYEDWTNPLPLSQLQDGEEQTFLATVARKPTISRRGRLSVIRVVLKDEAQAITAVWFNQPWLADKLTVGARYCFRGQIRRQGRLFQVQNPAYETLETDHSAEITPAFRPVYGLTAGLTQGMLRFLVGKVLEQLAGALPEPLPDWIRRKYRLCAVDFAYNRIHQPTDERDLLIARRRIAFEELFLLRTGLWLLRRRRRQHGCAWPLRLDTAAEKALAAMLASLPFTLTSAQSRAWREISFDLSDNRPMSRLLQGDVGSGKTVVAALAMLQCALGGAQAVLMAPTAVLAAQHHQTLTGLLASTPFKPQLLTGATRQPVRREILAGLAAGDIQMIVGTHALIEESVNFARLGLAITDEQHRFGVRQRRKLGRQDKETGQPDEKGGFDPHVLVMSATPIPRSLALVLYGDLDLSVIDELPPGRTPIETYTATSADRGRIEQLMRRFVTQGRQVYVVCPMIEEQEDLDLESVVATYNRLAQQVFPDLCVGLLHGALAAAAKETVMRDFYQGKIQILVSTTVIEVGVDNPNAAFMVIENSERFGLAQLHQLRGRIGRGPYRSLCVLISDSDDEMARQRLRAICHASDGFAVAEQDLQLRGPGDFFGTRQHGLPPLRMANLYRDRALMQEVQEALETIMQDDPDLQQPAHRRMCRMIMDRYPTEFSDIGL